MRVSEYLPRRSYHLGQINRASTLWILLDPTTVYLLIVYFLAFWDENVIAKACPINPRE